MTTTTASPSLAEQGLGTAAQSLVLVTALGCGLAAGVFYAFSSFVMAGLGRLAPAQGVAAMQSINVTAVRPAFMLVFGGSAVLCLAVAVTALVRRGPATPWLLAGAALYLVGALLLTMGYHVPRNDALARLDPDAPATAAAWADYLREWTRANHVRAAASAASAAAFVLGLLRA